MSPLRYFLTGVWLLVFAPLLAQQNLSLHFLPQGNAALETQPAKIDELRFDLSLPAVYVNALHDGFAYADLIRPVPGSDSLRLDIPSALAQLGDAGRLRINGQVDLLTLRLRVAGIQASVFARSRFDSYLAYPRDLLDLAWQGNGAFVGESLAIGPQAYGRAWHEVGAGAALRVGKVSLGLRLKYLRGLADVSLPAGTATFTTGAETFDLAAALDYQVMVSGLDLSDLGQGPQPVFGAVPANQGWGADLGLTFAPGDKWLLSLSAIDLGYIRWTEAASQYRLSGAWTFEGLDAAAYLDGGDSLAWAPLLDSMAADLTWEETGGAYSTPLPAKVYLSASWQALPLLRVGGLLHAEWYGGQMHPAVALNASTRVGKMLHAGLTYAVHHRQMDHLGAHALVKLGPMSLLVASDDVLAWVRPARARATNARLGIDICL
ncbi:MAG: hypothetical protein OHK0039_10620 [Bacteroidia bacterium]